MRKSLLLAFSFLMLFSFSATAQIVKEKTTRAERRAKYRANRRVDDAIDGAVDDAFDKIGSIFKKKKKKSKKNEDSAPPPPTTNEDSPTRSESKQTQEMSEEEMAEKMKAMEGMFGKSAKIKDSYTFHTTVTMKGYTEKSNGKKKEEYEMEWMFATDGSSFGMGTTKDKHDGLMIMDMTNGAMININEKDKQAMTFSMDMTDVISEQVEEHHSVSTIRKTGRTKTILGYSCEEYESEDDEMKGTFWYTSQIKGFDFSRLPKKFNKGKKNPWDQLAQKGGIMLESKMTEKKKKGKIHHMNATKVDKKNKTFKMSDYKVMSLGDIMNGQ